MRRIRPAAQAGRFYPADARRLAAEVAAHLERGAEGLPADVTPPKALIAPHAGYVYSGPVAGTAYAAWRGLRGRVRRVIVLGPAHRVPVRGLAAPTVDAFAGPLGPVPIDRAALEAVSDLPQVVFDDAAHADEHAIEVQIPFLQAVLGDFALVPFAVGQAEPGAVGAVLDRLWGDDTTRIVISSDLSHFHPHEAACALDRRTADAIERHDGDALHRDSACGRRAIQGLLSCGAGPDLRIRAVDLRTSGQTAGDRARVVGYGAFLAHAGGDAGEAR